MGFGALADAVLACSCCSATAWPIAAGAEAILSSSSPIGVVVAADRPLRLLAGRDDPAQRAGRQTMAAGRSAQFVERLFDRDDLGARLPRRRHRAAASPGTRWSSACWSASCIDAARPCLRAARRCARRCRGKRLLRADDGAADHHAALRHRPRAHPAVRPLRRRDRPAVRTGSASRARAGSTACRACCIAQVLAFTPIAFLVLIGVVQGISPSLEEAAQTLRARRWTTFRTVTWPLLRPGARQRLPARLRREHGRFRQSARARRQFRGAVDQDLLRRGRRRARSGPRGGAGDRAARLHARRLLAAAALARRAALHHGHRQGRCRRCRRRCRDASRWPCYRRGRALGRASPS